MTKAHSKSLKHTTNHCTGMKLNPSTLHRQLTEALATSVVWRGYAKHPKAENAYRSAYFCYQVGQLLDQAICDVCARYPLKKRQICFNTDDEKVTGEWLLDIVWTEDHRPEVGSKFAIPKKIWCAVECESSTNIRDFFVDFAKLVNVRSPMKIFLAGLNQTTASKAVAYQQMRLDQAAQYIAASEPSIESTDWCVGFWPSPKGKSGVSLWDSFEEHPHLNAIHLYRYADSKFVRA